MKKIKISDFIRKGRQRLNMTQKQLGDVLGKTPVDICKYELGINAPTSQTLLDFLVFMESKGKGFKIP
jgi:transcriptional regulator with XRE-family HTH domain